jgi:hypothetical protein
MATKHLIVGDNAAKNLFAAKEQFESEFEGDIIVLHDTLGIGSIYVNEQGTHDAVRTDFWKSIVPNFEAQVNDHATILDVIENLGEEDKVWFWMSPCVSDVCAYFWLLPIFQKHHGVLHVISIAGLPFFNEKGILFTPKNFSEVLPKEILKCKRLALQITPADFEIDGEEWQRLCGENAPVRTLAGNKRIESKPESFYDQIIFNQLQFATDFVKANKIITQTLAKVPDTVSDLFLVYRLRTLVTEGKLQIDGDANKAPKDWSIKKLD